MEGKQICSKDTTRKYVKLLKDNGEIIIEKDKRQNNKTHHLVINDKSEFNQIDNELSKLEGIISRLPDYVEEKAPKKPTKGQTWFSKAEMIMWHLQLSLFRVTMIPSHQNQSQNQGTQTLYKKILKLMIRVTLKQIKARKKTSQSYDFEHDIIDSLP